MTGKEMDQPQESRRLQVNQFVQVVSDKKLKRDGWERGNEALIVSYKESPVPGDPYLTRTYIAICPVNGDDVDLNDIQVADPRSFAAVSKERQSQLDEMLRQKFGK